MDSASIHERSIATRLSESEAGNAREPVDRVRASGFFAFAHVLAMMLALTAGILLEHSFTEGAWGTPAILCLAASVAVLVFGRREYRRALIDDARRRGLEDGAARDDAERRLDQLAKHRAPSPW